ncbi:hypothetical protein [Kineococcus sp. SYSU DK004]|uniref:hypothetical protein n=1 Tax=Kineococcus sp. SYSU DK004 TaxID=3383125 RepID=UPI003D7E7CD5
MRSPFLPMVLGLVALAALGACGTQTAPVTVTPTAAVGTGVPEAVTDGDVDGNIDEQVARYEWLAGGPPATSMPTRTCVTHQPTEEELAGIDPDDFVAHSQLAWQSCFDPDQYQDAPPCTPPPDLPGGGSFLCVEGTPLTQRVVDDWNAFADAEDTASARSLGMTLEEYRAAYPD